MSGEDEGEQKPEFTTKEFGLFSFKWNLWGLIGVTLVNTAIEVSGVQLYNPSPLYWSLFLET